MYCFAVKCLLLSFVYIFYIHVACKLNQSSIQLDFNNKLNDARLRTRIHVQI